MKRIISVLLTSFIVIFTLNAIHEVNTSNQQLHLQEIKLRNTQVELEKLDRDYKALQDDHTKTQEEKDAEIQRLKEQEAELQRQLQAKRLIKEQQAVAYAAAQQRTTSVSVAGTCADWVRQAGITEVDAALKLIARESGCRVNATGSLTNLGRAYGIPQALPGNKMASHGADWQTNPVTQLRWMKDYCLNRYGSFANALAHSYANNWY